MFLSEKKRKNTTCKVTQHTHEKEIHLRKEVVLRSGCPLKWHHGIKLYFTNSLTKQIVELKNCHKPRRESKGIIFSEVQCVNVSSLLIRKVYITLKYFVKF